MKIKVLDINSKQLAEETLNIETSESENHFLHTLNRYTRNKLRSGNSSTKTRGEVKYSTAKAYKQKGTGNARRGAKGSPLLKGGGVTFGPKPRSYKFKLNKKQINNSLKHLLANISSKLTILDIDSIETIKTKVAYKFINDLKTETPIVLIIDLTDFKTIKMFGNCKNILLMDINLLEPELLISSEKVIITKNAFNLYKGIL